MYGWMGTILRVDLTSGKIEKEPLSEELRRNYLGGRGINVRILYDEIKPGTDAFDPKNRVLISAGIICNTTVALIHMQQQHSVFVHFKFSSGWSCHTNSRE